MSTGSVGRAFRRYVAASSHSPLGWSSASAPLASTSRLQLSSGTGFFAQCTCSGGRRNYSSQPDERSKGPIVRKKRTILDLHALKKKHIPITVLTAHDYPSARFIEASSSPPSSPSASAAPPSTTTKPPPRGIDICLVGDSLAMVACGYTSTNSITLDEMLYHCRSVARGCTTSFLLADMPFGTYTSSVSQAVSNATRIIQEGNMDAVKIEGGAEIYDVVSKVTSVGIPVMAHIGLTPQRQAALSGFRVQGKSAEAAFEVYQNALLMQEAGAFAILIEAVPFKLAKFISERLTIPTIGIGAGSGCDGQVLVQLDMMGARSLERAPRFLQTFAEMEEIAVGAVRSYVDEVRAGTYPEDDKHGYPMEENEWEAFKKTVVDMEEENASAAPGLPRVIV
ncbi:3-methyl-2-oxobutanoate hydroxymethyltransferase [Pseudohyphozyma bogoriensis]|nr:3-methyl-2-oxobutanoate hydroxymethyltransferase [Pseudohyphozyma bogoriensis]